MSATLEQLRTWMKADENEHLEFKETNKALLLKHIRDNRKQGSQLSELLQVLPELSRTQVQWLLRELKTDGQVHSVGLTRAGRWYPGPSPDSLEADTIEERGVSLRLESRGARTRNRHAIDKQYPAKYTLNHAQIRQSIARNKRDQTRI
ncbi:MAG: hypothetical protein Q7N50_12330 [Armatimonadota bacterium]|nr:hypothetical protein [Armatimonadota bacterium]